MVVSENKKMKETKMLRKFKDYDRQLSLVVVMFSGQVMFSVMMFLSTRS